MERTRKKGFTIVELLTVMGVIAVLIGLMVPALALVKDYSKRIQQKAQFHGIDMGLEMYKTEFGSYPRSDDNSLIPAHATLDNSPYCGANKLAEALVGLDLIGFHPRADFRSDGRNDVVDDFGIQAILNVYDTQGTQAGWPAQKNIDTRKGPFVDLEKVNAYRLDEIYSNAPAPFVNNFDTLDAKGTNVQLYPLVLCDVYAQKRSGTGSKKTGTPILYYRARTSYSQQNFSIDGDATDDIYNYDDNSNLLSLGMPDGTTDHTVVKAVTTGNVLSEFENMIVNENVTTIRRPYRADAYILISAGKDGDFGTADDVFNFDKEVTE